MSISWFEFLCALALVILVKDYNGTLEESLNRFEEKIGIRTELPPDTIDATPPYYIPPIEKEKDGNNAH